MTQEAVPDDSTVLQVSGLSKSFGNSLILKGVSLTVFKGETICVLGPSGSGKSTLLRCINFLETPDQGAIYLRGQRLGMRGGGNIAMSSTELSQVRSRIGMVFQHFNLWPHLTVLQNIIESPIHVQRRPRDEVIFEAEELLKRVGLSEKRDSFPSRLSGGQKQRVGIARALAMKPDLLLFDEPTSALDPELVTEVVEVIKDLAKSGSTMVIVTHELGFAREVSSEVVFMAEGKIVEQSPPAQFFADPKTERTRQFIHRHLRGI